MNLCDDQMGLSQHSSESHNEVEYNQTLDPVSTSVNNNCIWISENPLELDPSQLLLASGLTCYLMYASGDQMLNQVVKDDRDHDSWV